MCPTEFSGNCSQVIAVFKMLFLVFNAILLFVGGRKGTLHGMGFLFSSIRQGGLQVFSSVLCPKRMPWLLLPHSSHLTACEIGKEWSVFGVHDHAMTCLSLEATATEREEKALQHILTFPV